MILNLHFATVSSLWSITDFDAGAVRNPNVYAARGFSAIVLITRNCMAFCNCQKSLFLLNILKISVSFTFSFMAVR